MQCTQFCASVRRAEFQSHMEPLNQDHSVMVSVVTNIGEEVEVLVEALKGWQEVNVGLEGATLEVGWEEVVKDLMHTDH